MSRKRLHRRREPVPIYQIASRKDRSQNCVDQKAHLQSQEQEKVNNAL